mgnify:CR=1 FL=1
MIPSITPQKLRFTAFIGLMGLLLVSCGSYEQASYYDNDGIYSRGTERVVVTESRNPQPAAQQGGDDFYQNYFGEKSQELDRYLQSEVFTDVDDYTSAQARDSLATDSLGVAMGNYYQDYNNDYAGQPGWGDSASNVSINLYGGMGWNTWGWGFPMYDWYWGGLYSPWYWNNWGWGVGWTGGRTSVETYTEGTIVVDVLDTKTRTLVWRGIIENAFSKPNPDDEKIRKVVARVMAEFPPM